MTTATNYGTIPIQVMTPDPTGSGGALINDNFIALADAYAGIGNALSSNRALLGEPIDDGTTTLIVQGDIYGDLALFVNGATSLDSGNIYTDGSGDLSVNGSFSSDGGDIWTDGGGNLYGNLPNYVRTTRQINGHNLTANVTISASDLTTGTLSAARLPATYVPTTTTVNGHALSANVTVTASDVSAVKGLASGTTAGHLVTWGSNGYTVADGGALPSFPTDFTNTAPTVITGNTGTLTWSMPFRATYFKKVIIILNNFSCTANQFPWQMFPVAFTNTPCLIDPQGFTAAPSNYATQGINGWCGGFVIGNYGVTNYTGILIAEGF